MQNLPPFKGRLNGFDLNCDLGEGLNNEALIMPFITSANIACGYHAGDVNTMYSCVDLAVKHKVSVGAHISYLDRENFGRMEMDLSDAEVFELVQQQMIVLNEVADLFKIRFSHVKPHGALYNQSAKNKNLAKVIARAVKDFDPQLILFGLSSSHSITEAQRLGLHTANEVFADRSYQDDGSLTPRSQPGALIDSVDEVLIQVRQMAEKGRVTTISGLSIPVVAETICIHGDGKKAVVFAKAIQELLQKNE